MNRPPFYTDEWYHCYSRGVDGRGTFIDTSDYARFQDLLFLANSTETLHRSDCKDRDSVYLKFRNTTLVDIGSYCLMPNHFHILLKAQEPTAVGKFMQKIGTSYTMYFNKKYERIGNLFVKPYRSKHIDTDTYLRQVFSYIHLNPLDVYDSTWRTQNILSASSQQFILTYAWSSLYDYENTKLRTELDILGTSAKKFLAEVSKPILESINDAKELELSMLMSR